MLFPCRGMGNKGSFLILRASTICLVLVVLSAECGRKDKFRKGEHYANVSKKLHNSIWERPEKDLNKGKICIGTNGRMSVPSNRDHHYRNLKDRYTNCTYVDGNLELTWLQDPGLDLSFLQYIREVTGYVLISHVDVQRVVLPRLQIIRGRTLFKMNVPDEEFALISTLSKMYTLELPALRDVLRGNIGLINNYNLCHVKTINWNEIISDPQGRYVFTYNFSSPERNCPPCHSKCEAGCWGDGEENCQKFSKENCSPQCFQGRCFGSNPRECCHLFCAGGCTGPKQSDCIACRNFYDDGVCTQECPPMQIYNTITYSWEPNPKGKYAYGATCVKNCPEHLLKDSGACVRVCPPQKKAQNGECVPCNGPCPKTCPGDTIIHSGNIDSFRGCTIIEGYIHILDNTFKGYTQFHPNYTFGDRFLPMHPDRLEVFSTLKEITGYLDIQANHSDFKNLSYFRNLEVIGGRALHDLFASLYVVKTSLESLELKSLKQINSGTVVMLENTNLCFAEKVNWKKIRRSSEHSLYLSNNGDAKTCKAKGLICDEQCTNDGCWGSGPDQCLSCANYKLGNTCIQSCSVLPGIYTAGYKECKPCHEQCGTSCFGPGPDNCTTCKHFKDGPFCVYQCPVNKYPSNGTCQSCHSICVDGCTGPKNFVGPGGCNSCEKAIVKENFVDVCLHKSDPCPDGYYDEWVGPQEQENLKALAGKSICRKCHPRCEKCSSYGFHITVCQKCARYVKGEQCEDECSTDDYADEETRECFPCDSECRGCSGPGPDNCLSCLNYKVYKNGNPANNSSFKCVSTCPPEFPHRAFPENEHSYCSDKATSMLLSSLSGNNKIIIISVIVSLSILFVVVIAVSYFYCRKMKEKENALKMTLKLTSMDDNEPLQPTDIQPNVSVIRVIKETDIRKGPMLGKGAFGTVYTGFWLKDGENNKIPVAIKILQKDSGGSNSKAFLEEASIMARVVHPNLLQLLAVCMTSDMMLITHLMSCGCLLDYVKKNRYNGKIDSQILLSFCAQIASGMDYLEKARLVHRDLAARNVLVHSRHCVKITDFGLAKLLDFNEDEYKAAGGKMPIKWLALECIQHRTFTHKSDVWAFGVTVWELLTFGERPYDNVSARDVPELLEKGERLPHPPIASVDVYKIMLLCWAMDAEDRPSFEELTNDFAKMALDPGRYLVIPGDKFMRLKNFARETKEQSIFSIPTSETCETRSECEEYPSSTSSIPFQYQNNINHKLLQYARYDRDSIGTAPSDVSSIKYCGDSAKMQEVQKGLDEFDSAKIQAQLDNLKECPMPLDEDDYLVPSPQQSVAASTYVDLIDSKIDNGNIFRVYPDFYKTNIDNPEYLMGNDTPSQTVGLPSVPEFIQATSSSSSSDTSNLAQPFQQHRISEEESDHEYYNDFDRLKRELQPLQRTKDGALV